MKLTPKLIKDYIRVRTDIISNNADWWLNYAKNELPTIEEYYERCVKDKGGKYDFTVRRYKTHSRQLPKIERVQYKLRLKNTDVRRYIEYSIYRNTPFNFKEVIKL